MAGKRGEGRVYLPKNSSKWMLAYYGPKADGGWGEIRESSHSETEDVARKLLSDRRRQAQNHREGIRPFEGPKAERLTVNALLDSLLQDYRAREIKSLESVLVHVKPVRRLLGQDRALRVTPERVRKYQERRKAEGRKNSTVNRELELLNSAYRLAIRERRISVAPWIPSLPENNTRRGFFEKSEIEDLLANLASPLDDVVRFAYVTGWRRGEILGLRWENVDRDAREIRLFDSKNGDGRVIPIDDTLLLVLERRWKAREFAGAGAAAISDVVFHSRGKQIFPTTLGRQWRAACVKTGLGRYVVDENGRQDYEGRIFHDLRRTAVRNLVRSGVDRTVAKKISGHRTDAMFDRYNIVSTEDLRQALSRRESYLDAEKPTSAVRPFPSRH